jgi:hypothetical protein
MTVKDIYQRYQLPWNLQQHMLRTGVLADRIVSGWHGKPIVGNDVVIACLLHDLGKVGVFRLDRPQPVDRDPDEIGRLKQLKDELNARFGTEEHAITMGLCHEAALPEKVIRIINAIDWDDVATLTAANDYEVLIAVYCDMRTGPNGIMSVRARLDDLLQRTYDGHLEGFQQYVEQAGDTERLLQKSVDFELTDIDPGQIEAELTKFLEYPIR